MRQERKNKVQNPEYQVTRDDVARAAFVSGATVSRVFNKKHVVKQATVERVMAAAQKLKYSPNTAARSLILSKSYGIGVLVPDIPGGDLLPIEGFHAVLAGIADTAISRGYFITLLFERDAQGRLIDIANLFRVNRIDGVIVVTSRVDHRLVREVCMHNYPRVVILGEYQNMPSSVVSTDLRKASLLLVKHMVNIGHRRIALLYGSGILRTADEHKEDFICAMKKCDINVDPQLIKRPESHAHKEIYEVTKGLLELSALPTAIIVDRHLMANAVLSAIRDKGLSVPEDISLGGFAVSRSNVLDISWTQVNFPTKQLGKRTAELLIDYIEGNGQEIVSEVLSPELFVGESSAPPSK